MASYQSPTFSADQARQMVAEAAENFAVDRTAGQAVRQMSQLALDAADLKRRIASTQREYANASDAGRSGHVFSELQEAMDGCQNAFAHLDRAAEVASQSLRGIAD